MKILVICGDCVQVNTSANLCHLAYLRGLVEAGHEVTLLSADGKDYRTDPSMMIPAGVKCYTVYGTTLYEKLSMRMRREGPASLRGENGSGEGSSQPSAGGWKKRIKKRVLSLYGVHGIYGKFVRKARRFRSEEIYDFVLSLSTPVTSHLTAHELITSGHILCGHWVQIWEDPWYSDAFGFNRRPEILAEERRLLSFAERVCYVSPITLSNQQKLFPESADKMFWQPLPAYYGGTTSMKTARRDLFGYFGDYSPVARNLRPFYDAAVQTGAEVNICGNPSTLFSSTEKIHIYPRLSLEELRPLEEKTGVLVFLCNRAGGQIPGKIYQYSATDKTILFILDGTEEEKAALREYFEPFHRYVFCENSVESIREAMERIKSEVFSDVNNAPLTQFTPKDIVQRILAEV